MGGCKSRCEHEEEKSKKFLSESEGMTEEHEVV